MTSAAHFALRAAPAVIGALGFAAVLLAARAGAGAWRGLRPRVEQTSQSQLAELYVFFDIRRLVALSPLLLAAVAVVVRVLPGSWLLALLAAAAAVAAPPLAWRRARRRRRQLLVAQLPDGLTLMAGSLRAGASAQSALDRVAQESPAPLAQEISRVLREQRLGTGLDEALEAMARRLALPDVTLWVVATSLARGIGGNLADVLERLAATLRTKAALEGKIDALTSQGRLQGIVVGLLPLALGIVLFRMDPVSMAPLIGTPGGWAALAVVLVLEAVGFFMIRRIVAIDV